MEPINVSLTLPETHAYALAELCKRIGFSDCRTNAVNDTEAYDMLAAMDLVRSALVQSGVSVR